jgi:DNA-binding response OmpR family regulator
MRHPRVLWLELASSGTGKNYQKHCKSSPITISQLPLDLLTKRYLTSTFDVILLDASCTGLTDSNAPVAGACAVLRELFEGPLLLLTPVSDEAGSVEAYNAGVDECIVHPIVPELLAAKVASWHRWTLAAIQQAEASSDGYWVQPGQSVFA